MTVLASYKYLGTKQVPLSLLRQLASGLCCYLDFLLNTEKGINMLPGNIISKVNLKKRNECSKPGEETDPARAQRQGKNALVLEGKRWTDTSEVGAWASNEDLVVLF